MQDPHILPKRIFPPRPEAWPPGAAAHLPGARSHAMRRRLQVFIGVFLLCALVSLVYTYMRPPIYLANARVQITPSGKAAPGEAAAEKNDTVAFLLEVQVLTSRPLLEKVAQRLWGASKSGDDVVQSLQDMLTVNSVAGSNVVLLEARGPQPQELARLVNTVIDAYREQQDQAGKAQATTQLDEARDELRIVNAKVAAQKKATEEFRVRAGIVSIERDENQVLSRLKGLGTALGGAAEREAVAEGKLRALEQATRSGTRAALAKDNPTVASIEQRLSQLREEWRALERQFTPRYLDMDPPAKALKIRIANLEQQLETERQKGQTDALASAQEELASVRASGQKLQQQLLSDKQSVQVFARNFAEHKSMQEAMQGLEKLQQAVQQRLVTLESREMARKPQLRVVEPATTPESPWRPRYTQDAAIGLAGSVVLGFLAVWFVEFFSRPEPTPTGPQAVVISPHWMGMPAPDVQAQLTTQTAESWSGSRVEAPRQLVQATPRELNPDEVERLLAAAAPDARPVLVALLCGLAAEELVAMQVMHADTVAMTLTVPGDAGRVMPLEGPLREWLTGQDAIPSSPLFSNLHGKALVLGDIHSLVTSSAFDADLMQPPSVTPEALNHTYVAHLVRQGLRFGELGRVVGRLSTATLNSLAPLAPEGPRVALEAVERWLPAVQDLRRSPFVVG